MFPWLRLTRILLGTVGKSKVDLFASTRVRLRVWPNDLDFNLHVNNSRYLALTDIARVHFFVRTGLWALASKQRAFPAIADMVAKFRRGLGVFDAVEIETRLLGWDERWAYLESRLLRDGRVIGVVTIRGVFKGPNGPIDLGGFLRKFGYSGESPALPKWIHGFVEGCDSLSGLIHEEEQHYVSTTRL